MKNTYTTVRKIKVSISEENEELRNQKYQFIRDSQYAQYQGLNSIMSFISSIYFKSGRDLKSEEFKQGMKLVTNSNPCFDNIEFGKGIDSKSAITQKAKSDFSIALKGGLAKGERPLPYYKRTFPLMTRSRDIKFYYDEEKIKIKWVNKIVFDVVFRDNVNENTIELKHTVNQIIIGKYKVMQSSFMFDKKNNLILLLTLQIPKNEQTELVQERALGVDLGIAKPVYMSINDSPFIRKGVGSAEEFLKVRTQMKARRTREYQKKTLAKGGSGRNKKLKALNKFAKQERNFANTYNHMLSKEVVKFALENKCSVIKLEDLKDNSFDNIILSNWSYYELQNMIKYKAERVGIKVVKVEAKYTSQTCSKCGNIDKENRKSQAEFECTKCGLKINADYNASINIANK